MPEGPSILIATEEMSIVAGKKVTFAGGNTRQPIKQLKGQTFKEVGSWGKHLLLFFSKSVLKIHFMLWGSYSVNEKKPNRNIRLQINAGKTKLYFYACAVSFLEDDPDKIYDWSADVLSPSWSEEAALEKISKQKNEMVCDVLMDQDVFAGVGNIIKNEVLFLLRLHPERKLKTLSRTKQLSLVREAHDYSWKFYYWKKNYELKKHWLIMRKKVCPICEGPVTRRETGKRKRLSHYCRNCQRDESGQ
jgi:endonuclease-8